MYELITLFFVVLLFIRNFAKKELIYSYYEYYNIISILFYKIEDIEVFKLYTFILSSIISFLFLTLYFYTDKRLILSLIVYILSLIISILLGNYIPSLFNKEYYIEQIIYIYLFIVIIDIILLFLLSELSRYFIKK